MNAIKTTATTTLEIKKSTFIGQVFPCSNRDDLKTQLDLHWKQHSKATHICVAFVGDSTLMILGLMIMENQPTVQVRLC
jgi:putative IMPACT (imprinted ancient) family translation regulator